MNALNQWLVSRALTVVVGFGLLLGATAANAAVRYVDDSGSDASDGLTWATAWATIQHAVDTVPSDGDEIRVAAGTYAENVTLPAAGRQNLLVKGGWDATTNTWAPATYVSTIQAGGVVVTVAAPATISGFTISSGTRGVWANVQGCVVEDSVLTGNGEGLGISYQGTVMNRCQVTGNTGDGIRGYSANGSPKVAGLVCRSCVIAGNGGNGAYITWDNGGNNHSYYYNCTIAGNAGHGYRFHGYAQRAYFENTILADNGGYATYSTGWGTSWNYLDSCCVWANAGGDHYNQWGALALGTGMIYTTPAFVGSGNYHLQAGSACIDAGADLSGVGVGDDLEGAARPLGGAYDIGAYESALAAAAKVPVTFADAAKADDSGDGLSAATAKKYIGSALAITADNGTCNVAAGTYSETVVLPPGVTLLGASAATTIIDRSTTVRVVNLPAVGSTLADVTVTGGTIGVYISGENATISGCIVEANAAQGVYVAAKYALIADSELSTNTEGIGVAMPGTEIERCTISSNSGDGIRGYFFSGQPKIAGMICRSCVIADNGGRGIYNNWDNGGGNHSYFYNCTVANNSGHGYESYSYAQSSFWTNTIVAANGGYATYTAGWGTSGTTLSYCCIFGNSSGAHFTNWPGNLSLGSGMLAVDPSFVGSGDYDLQTGSPCIDTGTDLSGSGVLDDIQGDARPIAAAYDIGAHETTNTAAVSYPVTYADITKPNDSGDGSSWATAKKYISSALAVTLDGGTCNVAAGTYAENVSLPPQVSLIGVDRNTVIISAAGTVVSIAESSCALQEVTVTGGSVGVIVTGESNTISGCIVTGNTQGVSVQAKYTALDDCELSGNGEGIAVVRPGTELDRCTITGNTGDGVRGYFFSGQPKIAGVVCRNCVIADNGGRGIYINWDNGGGNHSYFYNCTVADNGGHGYESYSYAQSSFWQNCILASNGGYATYTAGWGTSGTTLSYSCVYGNSGGIHFTNWTLTLGSGLLSADPKLAVNYDLLAGSPCIDAGTDLSGQGVTVDITGTARPIGSAYEIGAFESSLPPLTKYPVTYADTSQPDDSGDGSSWATAKKTIAAALTVTADGGTCNVAAGTYGEALTLPPQVTLAGVDRDTVIISSAGTVVSIPTANSALEEVTVTGGGLGVLVTGEDASITGCVITGNTSGVSLQAKYAVLTDCDLSANGEGIGVGKPGSELNACIVSGNTGDGIRGYFFGGEPKIAGLVCRNCLVVGNGGRGIYINWDNGGGNHSWFYNCTVSDNGGHGYESYSYAQSSTWQNCIISGNGGYGTYTGGWGYSLTTLSYDLVYGNAGGAHFNNWSAVVVGAGMLAADPLFVGSGDYRLQDASPALNTGSDLSAQGITSDLDGNARPLLGAYDIGAYELPNRSPQAVCQAATVTVDSNGNATVSAAAIDNGSSDPDGDTLTLSVDPATLTCADADSATVTLTVEDGNGGSDTCTATVTVQHAGTCADLQTAVYDALCDAGGFHTSAAEMIGLIDAAISAALGGSTICDTVTLAECRAALLAAVGL